MSVRTLNRPYITHWIRQLLDDGKKVIVSGLDGSGKSTHIANLYPIYRVFKSDQFVSELVDSGPSDYILMKRLLDHYQLFDRHPFVDKPVYSAAGFTDPNDIQKELDRLRCYSDLCREYELVIVLDDLYVARTIQPVFVKTHREQILESFRRFIAMVSPFCNVWLVDPFNNLEKSYVPCL